MLAIQVGYCCIPTDSGVFGVPLTTLVENDRSWRPDTDTPLVLQKVSFSARVSQRQGDRDRDTERDS